MDGHICPPSRDTRRRQEGAENGDEMHNTYLLTYLHACPCAWCGFCMSATLSASQFLTPYAWPELHPPAACNSHEIRHCLYYRGRYLTAYQGLSEFPDGAIHDVMTCTR